MGTTPMIAIFYVALARHALAAAPIESDPCGMIHTAPCPLPMSGDDVDPQDIERDRALMESKIHALEQLRSQLDAKRLALQKAVRRGPKVALHQRLEILQATDLHVQQAANAARTTVAWGAAESRDEQDTMATVAARIAKGRAVMEKQLRESEEADFARDSEALVQNIGLGVQARINHQMEVAESELQRDSKKLEVSMEKRFLRGMEHSFDRLRAAVAEGSSVRRERRLNAQERTLSPIWISPWASCYRAASRVLPGTSEDCSIGHASCCPRSRQIRGAWGALQGGDHPFEAAAYIRIGLAARCRRT